MTSSTVKKVVIERFDREPLAGFVNPACYLQAEGVELMSQTGSVTIVPYGEIKVVCFVKDFQAAGSPFEKRVFSSRPKLEGLWVRMQFRDGACQDGLLANNLLQMEPCGFTVVPPDPSSRDQKVFIPRAALTSFQVLGVVGSAVRRGRAKAKPKEQLEMFD